MNRRRFVKKIGLGAGACVAAVAGLWAGKAERRSRPRMTTATEVAMGGEADAWREGAALEAALPNAIAADVGYHPGPRFAPDGVSGRNFARLCFGYNSSEEIGEGIARLAAVCESRGLLGG